MAASAGAGAALPSWVMLERFVFRRDGLESFCDRRAYAAARTFTGVSFGVSFILAEPPTPSRLYISFPGAGPNDGIAACHLVAAHHNLVLLRLDIDLGGPEMMHEYFVYEVNPSDGMPGLRMLPSPRTHSFYREPVTCSFEPVAVGLLCQGEEEFIVAYLAIRRSPGAAVDAAGAAVYAEMWLLRSSVLRWEIRHIPIQCKADEGSDLFYWGTNAVVPFKDSLCWVNYSQGVLICDDVCGDSPTVSYIRFPPESYSRYPLRKELYRSLCVTEGGEELELVDVAREDGEGLGIVSPPTGFTISRWKARAAVKERLEWFGNDVVSVGELWKLNTPDKLPREVMLFPLPSMDKANAVQVIVYDWEPLVGTFSLVTIDFDSKKTPGSVALHIRGVEDLNADDGEMIRLRQYCFAQFLPAEFPKFLHTDEGEELARAVAASLEENKGIEGSDATDNKAEPEEEDAPSMAVKLDYPPLPEEPTGSKDLLCCVAIKLPDGRRIQRNFLNTDPIKMLWSFCSPQVEDGDKRAFHFVQPIPGASKDLDFKSDLTFKEAGLANSTIHLFWRSHDG